MDTDLIQRISKQADVLMALGVIGLVAMMMVPLPPTVLDVLITLNIGTALCILLVSMYVRRPLDFSVFPSLLLVATLFRLALNVSSTRLILLRGMAGKVIEAFGQFVVGGDLVVGLILFIILVVIQFVVITNGAQRVAEVAARFTLDEMPGKQMSIDSDLNAGLITEQEARKRRRDIEREADFYGAMDGASKFVRGDAIASIIIVCINIIGGVIIGCLKMQMPLIEALQRYALLTVGDGLVTQIPALLISTGTGMVVTRAASEDNLGAEVGGQIVAQPRALMVVGAVLIAFSLVPGLPTMAFVVVGAAILAVAWYFLRRQAADEQTQQPEEDEERPTQVLPPVGEFMQVDRIGIQIGYGLLPLADPEGGELLDRINGVRQRIGEQLGLMVPPVRVRDDVSLAPHEYTISIKDAEVARGKLHPSRMLVLSNTPEPPNITGQQTTDPAFGLPAKWIDKSETTVAEARGYTVVDPATVLATHLSEIIKSRAADILSRQDVQDMIDALREREPAAVNDVVPDLAPVGQVQQVLQQLLRERVSIRDFATIMEALGDGLRATESLADAAEVCRLAIARTIVGRYIDDDGNLPVLTLHPDIEQQLIESAMETTQGPVCALDSGQTLRILKQVRDMAQDALSDGTQPVILTSPQARRVTRQFISRDFPDVPVISQAEVPADVQVRILGQIGTQAEHSAA